MTLGTLLGAAFQVLRRNPRPMFGFSLIVTGLLTLITAGVVGFVVFFAFTRADSASNDDFETLQSGAVALAALSALVPVALSVVITALVQGVVVLEVARGTVAEKLTLRGLWRRARGRIGALIGWASALTAGVLVVLAALATLIGVIVVFGGVAGIAIGVLLGIAVFFGALVLWAWLGTRLSLVASVLMLERLPLRQAIGRSWSLTGGYFWRTLGIQLLVAAIFQVVSTIVGIPAQVASTFIGGIVDPNQQLDVAGFVIVLAAVSLILATVVSAITLVVQSSTTALIYIDLRMRKEGLDLELGRFVEARQAGDTSVPDPYLPPRTAPSTDPPTASWS